MRKWIYLLVVLVALVSVSAVAAQEQTYTVQARDNITGIANAYGVDVDALLIRNNIIDPNRIRVGQTLIIPATNSAFPQQHIVQNGETLFDIAIRYNTSVDELVTLNRLGNQNAITPGQVLQLPFVGGTNFGTGGGGNVPPAGLTGQVLPSNSGILYRVDTGETLNRIATAFGTTPQAIAALNGIPNVNRIEAGALLAIPNANTPIPQNPGTGGPVIDYPQGTVTYVVQAGDVLSTIAARFNTTVDAIRAYNNLRPADILFVGQVLYLPPTGGPVVTPPQPPPLTGYVTFNGFYRVRAGDTLFRIASAFNRNIYDIAEANGLLNLNSIFTGQALRIPGY